MDISEHMTGKWLGIRKYPLPTLECLGLTDTRTSKIYQCAASM